MNIADEFLQECTNGNIQIKDGPIPFHHTCQMHEILDVAASTDVVCPRTLLICSHFSPWDLNLPFRGSVTDI